jgi:two-component system sensor histidine kinase HydH
MANSTTTLLSPAGVAAAPRPLRWWGAGGGLLLGIVDTLGMWLLGMSFQLNGADAGWFVALYFSSSFALLGFLIGYVVEQRRGDRQKAEVIRSQLEALDAARTRLAQSEKLAALGQLAAAIAHEVRNPLAVIRSAAQSVGETLPDSAEARRSCSFITAEIDRLTSVTSTLLAFARPLHLDPQPVAVASVFDQALLLASAELAARRIDVERRIPTDLPLVNADADLLSQVILGLLGNAAEVMPGGGHVVLDARRDGQSVEIAVADSGPGVPRDLRARIFEPFFTTRPRGTGLGLAVARHIMQAHGGTIDVADNAGGGARFLLSLPASAAA